MKVIAIGDTHGHESWYDVIKDYEDKVDHFVMVGDYMDSLSVGAYEIVHNFRHILNEKRRLNDKLTLLIGNHDLPYFNDFDNCSGFNPTVHSEIAAEAKEAVKNGELEICKFIDGVMYSHAGLSKEWLANQSIPTNYSGSTIEKEVKLLFKCTAFSQDNPFRFQMRPRCCFYGDNNFQGPLWIRPNSLIANRAGDFNQVVGHTSYKVIREKSGIFFIDTMPNEFLVLEDGKRINPKSL